MSARATETGIFRVVFPPSPPWVTCSPNSLRTHWCSRVSSAVAHRINTSPVVPHVSVSDSSRVVAETAAGRPSSYTHVVSSPKSAFIEQSIRPDQLELPGLIIMATSERKVHSVLSVGSGNMVSGWNWIAGGGRPVGTRVP